VRKVCRTSERLAIARSACPPSAEVRGAGFALLATLDHPHFTLVLADLSELTINPLVTLPDRANTFYRIFYRTKRQSSAPVGTGGQRQLEKPQLKGTVQHRKGQPGTAIRRLIT
jgi:hypothetical protein